MIVDKIGNAPIYFGMNPRIKKALEFLQDNDISALDKGRHEIDGDDVFVNVVEYTSRTLEESVWEAHREYIDVQYVAGGHECIGYEYIGNLSVTQEYDDEKDCLLLKGEGNMVKCDAGTFMILFPEDAHMPGVQDSGPCEMRKAIVKVRV